MVINTPKLCDDVAFQPPQRDDPNFIPCSPIISPEEIPSFTKSSISNPDSNPLLEQSTAIPPRIGNIVVGAHVHIPEGRTIAKPALLGGGQETVVSTLASSSDRVLSSERLAEMGISKPEQVEQLKKQLDKMAGDKGWKLEVVDTPRGREIRGVVGDAAGTVGYVDEQEGDVKPNTNAKDSAEMVKRDKKREEYEQRKYESQMAQKAKEGVIKEEKRKKKQEELARQKKEIMEALMRDEGADEVVVLWDDEGDGDGDSYGEEAHGDYQQEHIRDEL